LAESGPRPCDSSALGAYGFIGLALMQLLIYHQYGICTTVRTFDIQAELRSFAFDVAGISAPRTP
jgi:hypothetical protein